MDLPERPPERPIRTLVAEDNDDFRLVLTMRLRMMGMDVATAADGEAAVEQSLAADAAGRPFDLILMDMEMPILDGYEATRRIRGHGRQGPILAMTAHASDDFGDCRRFGCDGHVAKPIDWDKLGAMIKESVGRPEEPAGKTEV
jgi:CheY-like chemotaxis protein